MKKEAVLTAKTRRLAMALGLILAAFALIMAGAGKGSDAMCGCGFLLILAAMLYPPIREIGERKKPCWATHDRLVDIPRLRMLR